MSEYADIKIKNLVVYTFANYLKDDVVSHFFTKDDLYIY